MKHAESRRETVSTPLTSVCTTYDDTHHLYRTRQWMKHLCTSVSQLPYVRVHLPYFFRTPTLITVAPPVGIPLPGDVTRTDAPSLTHRWRFCESVMLLITTLWRTWHIAFVLDVIRIGSGPHCHCPARVTLPVQVWVAPWHFRALLLWTSFLTVTVVTIRHGLEVRVIDRVVRGNRRIPFTLIPTTCVSH